MSHLADLRSYYSEGRLLPFMGAGASMSVTWDGGKRRGLSWEEMVNEACAMLDFSDSNLARIRGSDLHILEYFKAKNGGHVAKLTNWLQKQMCPSDAIIAESGIHKALAALDKCRIIYTTNYDNFIERCFALNGRACRTVAIESDMGIRNDECEIVKFHGDWDHPDQIVLTESDYIERMELRTAMDYRLRADLLGRVILFIGYSFRDQNVSYLYRLFTKEYKGKRFSKRGERAYIMLEDPSDFEYSLFGERDISVIPIEGSRKTEEIRTALMDIVK